MKFTAVGDVLPQKRMTHSYDGFEKVKEFICQGDGRFFNLETTLNREGECFASQFSGGTYVRTDPEVFYDMLRFGFNMTSANNNHTFDFSYEGLAKTLGTLNESGITHSGIGNNLHQASAPAYLETDKGRVGLVSVNTYFDAPMMAGMQSRRVPGRPGINGIRVTQKMILPPDAFAFAQTIAKKTGINAESDLDRASGYTLPLPDGICELGSLRCILGEDYGTVYEMHPSDVNRLKESIKEAARSCDYVMVSIHTHQIYGTATEENPPFMEELAHLAVDEGANAVIVHGPHCLRGIEVYRDSPVFYSLGDFVLELYDVPLAPEDFYMKYGLTSDAGIMNLLETRSKGFTRGLMEDPSMLESVIPYWEADGKKLTSLKLMPIRISRGEGKHLEGLPQPAADTEFMNRLADMSKTYGVTIKMEDGIAVCSW
ncbi:MAG: CapA family protein [Clostridia bacterium]|nr:CapA family protein [Clostridia bacterium]